MSESRCSASRNSLPLSVDAAASRGRRQRCPVYIAGLCKHPLVRGEKGVLLCIAPDQRQAGIMLGYCASRLRAIADPQAARRQPHQRHTRIVEWHQHRGASCDRFRRLRGPTYIAVIADEAAFWYSDEFSANADNEILNAVRPGLATTGGPLIIAVRPMQSAACFGKPQAALRRRRRSADPSRARHVA